MKTILITTAQKTVYAGQVPDDQDMTATSMPLFSARQAIYWGTTKGITELAQTGPTDKSSISAPADAPMINNILEIFEITPEAWDKWLSA